MTTAALRTEPDVDLADGPGTAEREEVVIRPIPRREPPFDDEVADYRLPDLRDGSPLRRVVLGPWDQPLPFTTPRLAEPSALRLATPRDPFAARPTGRQALPDPEAWSRRLITTMFEVVAGRRPARQLGLLTSPTVAAGFGTVAVRAGRLARLVAASPSPQIRSVRVSEPADGVAEVCVTVAARGRVHAIAMRLEGLDGRWVCVKLEVG